MKRVFTARKKIFFFFFLGNFHATFLTPFMTTQLSLTPHRIITTLIRINNEGFIFTIRFKVSGSVFFYYWIQTEAIKFKFFLLKLKLKFKTCEKRRDEEGCEGWRVLKRFRESLSPKKKRFELFIFISSFRNVYYNLLPLSL